MFTVKPVRDKELQKALAAVFSCPCLEDCYAFLAGNTEDGETITSLIGFAQFVMHGDTDAILQTVSGVEDREAMVILVRTLMNFVYRAGIPVLYLEENACSKEDAAEYGFRRDHAGRLAIDLVRFYRSPCHYQSEP